MRNNLWNDHVYKKNIFKPHICFEPHIDSYSSSNKFANTLKNYLILVISQN